MNKRIVQTAGRESLGDFAPVFAHLNDDVLFEEVLKLQEIRQAPNGLRPYRMLIIKEWYLEINLKFSK